jgi:3-oxoacyl-[acyl-carrier-protein] synthase II
VKVTINGIGAVGGFGSGIEALERALVHGAIAPQSIEFETTKGRISVPGFQADTAALSEFVPTRILRRMAHNSRIALLAAFSALADAQMLQPKQRGRLGIIVATGYGATCNNFDFQHLSNDGADFSGSPTKFSNSVHNAAAANISIALSDKGPNHSISHLDMSFPSALLTAMQWLFEDRVDTVLVGGVDEFCKALAYTWQFAHPSESDRSNLPLVGEGACFFVLSNNQDPELSRYGVIEEAAIGRSQNTPKALPRAQAYFMGIQDFTMQPSLVRDRLTADAKLAAYAHLYGIMPVAATFDLAVAALSLKLDKLFPSMPFVEIEPPLPLITSEQDLANGPICCFQIGVGNTYGWITIGK